MYRIIGADGREYGPISADQLRQWIAENRAHAATRVLVEGSTEWKTLGSLPEFSLLFPAAAPQPVAPVIFPASTGLAPKTNGFAIAGFVLGIVSLLLSCCCYGLPFNVLGLVFSIIALVQINDQPHRYNGKSMAVTGIVLCILSFFLAILFIICAMAFGGWNGVTHHEYRL